MNKTKTHNEPRLITPGVMADRLGVPLRRVLYVLATRDHIHPAARAGILRLYDSEAVRLVKRELESIAGRKGDKP